MKHANPREHVISLGMPRFPRADFRYWDIKNREIQGIANMRWKDQRCSHVAARL